MRLQNILSVCFMLYIAGCRTGAEDNLETAKTESNLKSSDAQVRCDAFNELFGAHTGEGEKPSRKQLYGKTTEEIHNLLGEPTSVSSLQYQGVKWLDVTYRFEVCPSKGGHDAWEKGWRYSPSVIFRNGISVPPLRVSEELEWDKYSIPPKHLQFKEGGTFP